MVATRWSGAFARITHDVPPYTIGAGSPYKLGGLNLIGLKRHGFTLEMRKTLIRAFRLTYRSGLHLREALARIEEEVELNAHVKHWIEFCRNSRRGLIGFQGLVVEPEEDFADYEELLEKV